MTNKSTKKALLLSALSMLLCVAMLVGTTFAWFTDAVTSGKNKIVAGNLDIELEYTKDPSDADSWATVKDATDLLNKDALWEPGHAEVVYLRISNLGTLALKYQFAMNIYSEVEGTNVAGEKFMLSDHLKYGVVDFTAKFADRDAAVKAVESSAVALDNYTVNGTMLAGDPAKTVALVVYMPTSVGNEANYRGTQIPTIELGVELKATQLAYEKDFFGPDYDENAPWLGSANLDWYTADPTATEFTISTAEELAGFAQIVNGTAVVGSTLSLRSTPVPLHDDFQNKTVKLDKDIDLNDLAWTPIGRIGTTSTDFTYSFRGTFDGQNHTVKNLDVDNTGWAGLFGIAYQATFKNVKLSGVSINSNRMAGSLVGQLYGSIDNCHAENVNIFVIPNAVGDTYDNGDKVGGIVGWLGDNGNNRTLTNCSVKNAEISAYRDVAGIAGYVAQSTTVSGNSVTKVDVVVDQRENFYGEKDPNAGLIYGRTGGAIVESGNTTDEESTVAETYYKDGFILYEGSDSEDVTFYRVPDDYAKTTVKVPEGVTNIGGYAFAYNTNVEKIVLPSTVTTLNDRAFRDTSASTVVLNEGLENISYQAFRNASNVKSVEIPSSVKTISLEAFQNSGVTELVIPATVTTIEYGGLRDMKKLTKVTIEGNVDIPVYAFRACTELRTVILNGDDVTFGGGSRGMIFTNKENGDGSAITIIVKNETVKERLLAADTAAKDYGGYTIVVGAIPATNAEDLKDALANGEDVILTEDVKTEAATTAPYGNKYAVKLDGGVLDGNGNELYMECYGDDYGVMTSGGTIKNITIKEGCRAVMIMYATEDVIIDNANIGGDGVLYPINTGESGPTPVKLIVTNSTIAGWTSFGDAVSEASFTNVKFEQGTYYNDIYGRVLKPYVNTTLTDCSFVKSMNLDLSGLAAGQKVTFTNCTVDGKAVDASVFTIPTTDAEYDTELFTVDLPSWASSINDCIIFN